MQLDGKSALDRAFRHVRSREQAPSALAQRHAVELEGTGVQLVDRGVETIGLTCPGHEVGETAATSRTQPPRMDRHGVGLPEEQLECRRRLDRDAYVVAV